MRREFSSIFLFFRRLTMRYQKSKTSNYYLKRFYKEKAKWLCSIGEYNPAKGYIKDRIRMDGIEIYLPEDKQYVKYPKNSNTQKWLKRYSNRRFRRNIIDELPIKSNYNRKYTEYWWTLW